MNIEEELKEFNRFWEEQKQALHDVFRFEGLKGAAYETWKAAKTHAEESAKRFVIIKRKAAHAEPSSYPWIVVCVESGVLEDFRSEEAAKEWSESCGYQVVGK